MKHKYVNLQLKKVGNWTYINASTFGQFSPAHTSEGVCPRQRCYMSVEETQCVFEKALFILKSGIYHQCHQRPWQTYHVCSTFLLQRGVEHRCAQVFALPPAEGGRDLQVAGGTLGAPRETRLTQCDFRGEPDVSDICRGNVDAGVYNDTTAACLNVVYPGMRLWYTNWILINQHTVNNSIVCHSRR